MKYCAELSNKPEVHGQRSKHRWRQHPCFLSAKNCCTCDKALEASAKCPRVFADRHRCLQDLSCQGLRIGDWAQDPRLPARQDRPVSNNPKVLNRFIP